MEGFHWPQTDGELEEYKARSRDAAIQLYRQAWSAGDADMLERLRRFAPLAFTTREELEASVR